MLIETIYPPRCVSCRLPVDSGKCICERCLAGLHLLCTEVSAPVVGCYDTLWSFAAFDGSWKNIIHRLKYTIATSPIRAVSNLIEGHLGRFQDADCIVPVPLHWLRYVKRGFNQSASIAKAVSKVIKKPVAKRALVKIRHTKPQVVLSRDGREVNLKGAFARPRFFPSPVEGKSVLIVDDVVTSGTTVNECAKVLRGAGARRVDVLTLAKAL